MNASVASAPDTQQIAKAGMTNSAFGVASRASSGFCRAGILLLIASRYGPAVFGKLALAISMTEIFRIFSEFGIDTIAIRRFARSAPAHRPHLLAQILTSKLLTASVCYAVSLLVMVGITRDRTTLLLGATAGLSLFSANLVGAFSSYYQSQLRMREAFPATLTAFSLYIVVAGAAIFTHSPLVLVVALLPLCEFLNFALLKRKVRGIPDIHFDFAATVSLFRESLPIGLMAAMVMLYFRLDNILIYKFVGSAALGLYAAGFRIVEPALMVPHAFSISLFTILSSRFEDKSPQHRILQAIFHAMWPAYVFILCAIAVLVFGGQILLRHFGAAYLAAYPVLRVLAFVLFFRTVNITLTSVLNSEGKYAAVAKVTATTLLVNIIAALLLIPSFGIQGAAWAAFATELWNMIAQIVCVAYERRMKPDEPVYGLVCVEPECD
jgi:O-antigen/teichoic acid export membrane protein